MRDCLRLKNAPIEFRSFISLKTKDDSADVPWATDFYSTNSPILSK